ncbi:MAG: hypothetical protein IKS15_04745 [Opitutales bacterium]|nr:hypothetical protein [Opitutales bacterium]
MKKLTLIMIAITSSLCALGADETPKKPYAEWARFSRYQNENKALKEKNTPPPVAVFMGDSITDMWSNVIHKEFFKENNYLGRGLCGQVTIQMIARFRKDVLDFNPKVVVIMAGTNDIAENEGYTELDDIAGNVINMAELAAANNMVPVICSITPAGEYRWRKRIENVAQKIIEVNKMLKDYCDKNGVIYLDYHTALSDQNGAMPAEYSGDGVHPNLKCYKIMEPMAKAAVEKALALHQKKFGK